MLTPAGSSFPYHKDLENKNIRIAPSFPSLEDLEIATEVLSDVTLKIDGKSVDTQGVVGTTVTYPINETLAVGKHTISFEGNLNVSETAAKNKIIISKVDLGGDKAADSKLNITKYVAESFPTLSAKTSSDDLILTISNPKDSDEDITVLGFGIKWDIVSASIDGESIAIDKDFNDQIAAKAKSIAAGNSIELRVQAAKSSTVQVNAIKVKAGNQTFKTLKRWKGRFYPSLPCSWP